MKVKTKKLKPNPTCPPYQTLGRRVLDKQKWKYEPRCRLLRGEHLRRTPNGGASSVSTGRLTAKHRFLFLTCWLLALFAGVAIASEQSNPADLSSPQVIAPHQLDVRLRSIGAGPPDANTPNASVVKKPPQSSFYIAGTPLRGNPQKPGSQRARQLWRSRISVPQNEKDNKYRDELRRLIAQIRSIKFEPKNQEPKPVIAIEPAPMTEPNETESPAEVPQEHTEKETEPQPDSVLPYEPVSEQTLQMLENVSQQPDQLHNPLELADILFLSGNLKQATMFYQHALNRKDPNDVTSTGDRAWILFQIGNCLRDDDLPAAEKMYRQLIAEYLNCPWTDLAKARQNLIDWYLNDKPQTLIAECKSYLSADRF